MEKEMQPWQEVSREEIFRKYSRGMEKIIFRLPAGQEKDFYIKRENNVICTLALTKDRQVILARQYRPGPGKILNELPGGGLDPDEEPIKGAERELLEETGYKGQIKYVASSWDDAYSTRYRYCFAAIDCEKVSEPKNDPDEPVEVVLMPLDQFRDHLRSGQLTDVEVGYLGLDFLGLL